MNQFFGEKGKVILKVAFTFEGNNVTHFKYFE